MNIINLNTISKSRILLVYIPVLCCTILFSSCVGNKKYAEVQSQRDQFQTNLEECQLKNSRLQSQINEINQEADEMVSLRNEISDLESRLNEANNKIIELQNQEPDCPEAMKEGVYFKVQIGAFKERDISENLDQSVNLDVEKEGGLDEIVLGQFRDYYQADSLQNHLRAMGVKDAWIVPYKDGKRVPLKEVLDTIRD
jgi:seryl-tRNA synthetase